MTNFENDIVCACKDHLLCVIIAPFCCTFQISCFLVGYHHCLHSSSRDFHSFHSSVDAYIDDPVGPSICVFTQLAASSVIFTASIPSAVAVRDSLIPIEHLKAIRSKQTLHCALPQTEAYAVLPVDSCWPHILLCMRKFHYRIDMGCPFKCFRCFLRLRKCSRSTLNTILTDACSPLKCV